MKKVPLFFKEMKIIEYIPKDDQVTIRIILNDGTDKAFERTVTITEPEHMVNTWMQEIRNKVKKRHTHIDLDDSPLAGHVVITYEQEEDKLMEKMIKFLMHMKERIRSGKQHRMSYYDIMLKVKDQKIEF